MRWGSGGRPTGAARSCCWGRCMPTWARCPGAAAAPGSGRRSPLRWMRCARKTMSWSSRGAGGGGGGGGVWGGWGGGRDALRAKNDVRVIEGAGSPAEINLYASDIVNLRVARHAAARCLLVTDIDRGGAFAHLY